MTEEDFYKSKPEPEPEPVEKPVPAAPPAAVSAVEPVDTRPAPRSGVEEEEARAFWREYGRELVRGTAQNIDAIGRQVLLVDGLLVGLYTAAVVFGDLRSGTPNGGTLNGWQVLLYLLPLIFLLFSLLFAGGMFFMEKIPLDLRTGRGARTLYAETVRNKLVFLRTSMLLALAVVALIGALWVYLSGG